MTINPCPSIQTLMKKTAGFFFCIFFCLPLSAQIHAADSTVQVAGHWHMHDKQNYHVTEESNVIKNEADTINAAKITYQLDIEILDTSEDSYTIQWLSHDYRIIKATDRQLIPLYKLGENSRIVFRTTETGKFKEIVNGDELLEHNKKEFELLVSQYDTIPAVKQWIDKFEDRYTTRETIETTAARLINQFYVFHGANYKLGEEVNSQVKLSNPYSGIPFDAVMTVSLDEMDALNDYSILRMWQTANSAQLSRFAQNLIKEVAREMNVDVKERLQNISPLINETRIASQIHGSTGWVIYCTQTTEVSLDNVLNIEETTIELQ